MVLTIWSVSPFKKYYYCAIKDHKIRLESIKDHKKDGHAVEKADAYLTINGRRKRKKSTKGWHLCVEWRDGTTSREKLASLKESYPVQEGRICRRYWDRRGTCL